MNWKVVVVAGIVLLAFALGGFIGSAVSIAVDRATRQSGSAARLDEEIALGVTDIEKSFFQKITAVNGGEYPLQDIDEAGVHYAWLSSTMSYEGQFKDVEKGNVLGGLRQLLVDVGPKLEALNLGVLPGSYQLHELGTGTLEISPTHVIVTVQYVGKEVPEFHVSWTFVVSMATGRGTLLASQYYCNTSYCNSVPQDLSSPAELPPAKGAAIPQAAWIGESRLTAKFLAPDSQSKK